MCCIKFFLEPYAYVACDCQWKELGNADTVTVGDDSALSKVQRRSIRELYAGECIATHVRHVASSLRRGDAWTGASLPRLAVP